MSIGKMHKLCWQVLCILTMNIYAAEMHNYTSLSYSKARKRFSLLKRFRLGHEIFDCIKFTDNLFNFMAFFLRGGENFDFVIFR